MFSSNQQLTISGSLTVDAIKNAIILATNTFENTHDLCFQISQDNTKYYLGVKYGGETPEDWSDFPFDFDPDIIARIIKQHISKQPVEFGSLDGSYEKGFLMRAATDIHKPTDIRHSYCAIVGFEPYALFYAK